MHTDVEHVARALYDANENARGWEWEPELLKQRFREIAYKAIASIEELEETQTSVALPRNEGGPIAVDGYAQTLGLLPLRIPAFIAIHVGPKHVFHSVNQPYRKLVGKRRLLGQPVRDVFPDLEGQGFFEKLDNVYETGRTFTGNLVPVKVQRQVSGPAETRLIDLSYERIVDEAGERLGILVQGHDVTSAIRVPQTSGI